MSIRTVNGSLCLAIDLVQSILWQPKPRDGQQVYCKFQLISKLAWLANYASYYWGGPIGLHCARLTSTSSIETASSKLARLAFSGTAPVSGLTAAVERAHSHRARSGSKRPARVSVLPLFLRVPPRIPCRFKSPRINHASPPSSEPLNFPHISSSFSLRIRRHSGCSNIRPSADDGNGWKGGDAGPRPQSNVEY